MNRHLSPAKCDQMDPQLSPAKELSPDSNDTDDSSTEDQANVDFLRTMHVNQSNMPEIIQKLKSTVDYRVKICDDVNTNLLEQFPYFFTHSDLVSGFLKFHIHH